MYDLIKITALDISTLESQPMNDLTTALAVLHLVTLTIKDGSLHGSYHLVQSRGNE